MKLENKEGVWKSDDFWSFRPKDDDWFYIHNTNKAKVLEASSDGKIIFEDFKEGKKHFNVWQSQQTLCKVYKRCTIGVQSLLR